MISSVKVKKINCAGTFFGASGLFRLILVFLGISCSAMAQSSDSTRGTSFCACGAYPPLQVAELESSALKGDKTDADTMYFYYGFVKYSPKDWRYWAQIAAENGNVQDQIELAKLLQGFLSPDLRDTHSLEDVLRSFFWAKVASEDTSESYNFSPAKLFISDHNKLKQGYWKAIAAEPNQNPWIVKEAQYLFSGKPEIFESISGVGLSDTNRTPCDKNKNCNPYNQVPLNPDNISAVRINALLGDCNAAAYLTGYFRNRNTAEFEYWLVISAENGDAEDQKILAREMSKNKSLNDKTRGAFWARRALSNHGNTINRDGACKGF